MGRNKIKIQKIECAIRRRATFQKRSHGLIKKAKELSVLCDADVALIIISPTGKAQHFSTRPGIEQLIGRFNANVQEENKAEMCSGNKEQCKGGCCESHLLESSDPFLPAQQIETGQVSGTSGTNPSPGVQVLPLTQSSHKNIPMQEPHLLEASQGGEHVQMLGFPFVERNEAMVCSDIMDELPSLLLIDNFLESESLPSSSEQTKNGPLSTNPASGLQSAHWNIPMQQSQMWKMELQQDKEQAQMPGVPRLQIGYPSRIETVGDDLVALRKL